MKLNSLELLHMLIDEHIGNVWDSSCCVTFKHAQDNAQHADMKFFVNGYDPYMECLCKSGRYLLSAHAAGYGDPKWWKTSINDWMKGWEVKA